MNKEELMRVFPQTMQKRALGLLLDQIGSKITVTDVGHTSGSSVAAEIPTNSLVTDVFFLVTEAYNTSGSTALNIGDTSGSVGFLANTNITKTLDAFNGNTTAHRGTYLADAAGKFYSDEDQVVFTVTSGSTLGAGKVITRFFEIP